MDVFWEGDRPGPTSVVIDGVEIVKGSRVRLHPRPGGDVMDAALAGRTAYVESIEQDFEDKVHIVVVVEDDPGRDLGDAKQPGHRFFFSVDEVAPLGADEPGSIEPGAIHPNAGAQHVTETESNTVASHMAELEAAQ